MTKKLVGLWLTEETRIALRAYSTERKTKMSVLAERFLREGLGLIAEERLEGPALPAVRQVIEEITGRQTERLAKLVVKGVVEAGIDRRLTYALLNHEAGAENARTIFVAAETAALDSLRRRMGEEDR